MKTRFQVFVEKHPFGRWFTNFVLIMVLFAFGAYVHHENNKWLPVLCASKRNLNDSIQDSYIRLHRQQDFLYELDTSQRQIKDFTRQDIVIAINDTQGIINRQTNAYMAYQSLDCKGVK